MRLYTNVIAVPGTDSLILNGKMTRQQSSPISTCSLYSPLVRSLWCDVQSELTTFLPPFCSLPQTSYPHRKWLITCIGEQNIKRLFTQNAPFWMEIQRID